LSRNQDHERREILVRGADAVGQPRSHAGPSDDLISGVHEDLGGRVIELRCMHRPHNRNLVGDGRKMRQQRGHLGARLTEPAEGVRRSKEAWNALDEDELLAPEQTVRANLAVQLVQARLVVEHVKG
jgi:hypothetical protein